MDATYNVNDYNFHLITVIVLDDYQEGIPVAWGISNREDKIVIKYILEAIKSSCGNLSSKWFMLDMAPQYYNAGEKYLIQRTLSIYGVLGTLIVLGGKQ